MTASRRTLARIENARDARSFTCSCYRRLPLFQNDRIKDAFAHRLAFLHERGAFKLYAWVIMPDHVHLIVQPTGITIPTLLRQLKPCFGRTVIERWRELDARILNRLTDSQGRQRFWQPGGGYEPKHQNRTPASRKDRIPSREPGPAQVV